MINSTEPELNTNGSFFLLCILFLLGCLIQSPADSIKTYTMYSLI